MNAKFDTYALQFNPHKAGSLHTDVGCGGWALTTASQNKEEAWQALKLLTSHEACLGVLAHFGASVSRLSALNSPEYWPFPATADRKVLIESLDYARLMPVSVNFNIVDPLLRRWYAKLWNGSVTVKECVEGAHKELKSEMDKLSKT
jgi:ABC-type glycerol-3-phosphate transport system substrate-binding protein